MPSEPWSKNCSFLSCQCWGSSAAVVTCSTHLQSWLFLIWIKSEWRKDGWTQYIHKQRKRVVNSSLMYTLCSFTHYILVLELNRAKLFHRGNLQNKAKHLDICRNSRFVTYRVGSEHFGNTVLSPILVVLSLTFEVCAWSMLQHIPATFPLLPSHLHETYLGGRINEAKVHADHLGGQPCWRFQLSGLLRGTFH